MDAKWKELAKNKKNAEAMVEFIRYFDWVSFIQLQRAFEPYMQVYGNILIEMEDNVILWSGMSQEFTDMVLNLIKAKKIYYHPGAMLNYMMDGGVLDIPLYKQKREYKTPHWVPTMLRTVPR